MAATAWVFPGQGAQHKGMGADLFGRYPEQCAAADAVLGFSVEQLCLGDDSARLTDTANLQPALFIVNALHFWDRAEREPMPGYLAGHSLGEFNALLAAGAFDFETGVRLVRRRGELMAQAVGGAMAAAVGPQVSRIPDLLRDEGVADVDVANYNSSEQLVLSGPVESVRRAGELVTRAKAGRVVPLRVSAAFHSRQMTQAADRFGEFLAGFAMSDPRIPVIANVTARPYAPGEVARTLAAQVRNSVRWADTMRYLMAHGIDTVAEVGPGRVLTGLWAAEHRTWLAERAAEPPAAAAAAPQPGDRAEPAPQVPKQREPEPASAPASAPVVAVRPEAGVSQVAIRPDTSRSMTAVDPGRLGDPGFRRDYGIRYAYLAGSMYKGIASTELVVRMARAGLMGFFGAGGLRPDRLEQALLTLREQLGPQGRFGMNLLHAMHDPRIEERTVELYLRHDVRFVEAAGFVQLTPALVRYRLSGAYRGADGRPVAPRRLLAKVSRPEVAAAFMRPAPEAVVRRLVEQGALTPQEAEAGLGLPVSDDVCVEADSGGHTDGGVAYALMPAMLRLRDEIAGQHAYPGPIRVGAAGGLGSPESIAAAFVLGADFVVTGSVNQCSVEAGVSPLVKTMLAQCDVQDTAYAPAGDMFEAGARVQVLRKGTLFAARANKLMQLYRQCGGLDDIDAQTRTTIEETYFRCGFDQVWKETREYYLAAGRPEEVTRAERDPRHLMALVFRWYFVHTTRAAIHGDDSEKVNFQIHTGPAMGAFNRFVRGTELEDWRGRHVDEIAERLMRGAAEVLSARMGLLVNQ
ncbi:ACP S-malonyltransferase [Catellatospora vulcania]|uniref:ACP S-malonyltransferase n=1 Tax=Catellatospora vulcania TaxID=1460450 RepID=UPI001E468990|nr:ACP S-malonyltransferase [Catellatospora vulcania]